MQMSVLMTHYSGEVVAQGKNAGYAEQALRRDLERIRKRVDGMRKDPTTPDTRLADDPLPFNPASVDALIELAVVS